MGDVTIAIESPEQSDVAALIKASDDYHAALYPAESNYLVDIAVLLDDNVRFFVARMSGGAAVGCGAILLFRETAVASAEIKRMWVDPSVRGAGLGRRLLSELETAALDEGATVLRLETGISQPEALRLYQAAGYRERGPFGSYTSDPLSIFMEKSLV